jgi:hypothetical protein
MLINNDESATQELLEIIKWRSSHDTEVGGGGRIIVSKYWSKSEIRVSRCTSENSQRKPNWR